jgi:hypothetical protein
MSQPQIIEFVLRGSIAGKDISARQGVPFIQFAEFNEDVQKYVQGSDSRSVLRDVQVQVEESSYLLRALIPAGILASLFSDTARLAQPGSLAEIDGHRAEVVLRWQERAKMEPTLVYAVRSPAGAFAPVSVTAASNFSREKKGVWVASEHYLIGEITDWGGAQDVNVHMRVRHSRKLIKIDATPDQIRQQRDNLVLHRARPRFRRARTDNRGAAQLSPDRLAGLRAQGGRG